MRISYSDLQAFKQCPKRYQFKVLERRKEPKSKEQVFGTLIHECLKFMFTHDPLFPTLDQVIEHYNERFPIASPESSTKAGADWSEQEIEIYKKQGISLLKKFYERNAPWNFVIVDLESKFEVALTDKKTGSGHILAGIMDRVDKLPDGIFEIIDYKTAKKLPAQEKVDRDLQLSIYAMGLQKRWPHISSDKIKLSLQFLKHDEKLSTSRSEEDFKKTETDVIETIRDIESRVKDGKEFEPVVSPLCDFCSFKSLCPAWKHLYKNVKSEEIDGEKIPEVMSEYFKLREEKAKIESRLKELNRLLTRYLLEEQIDRVFDDQGVIAKRMLEKYQYDFEAIRLILEPLGKWQEVLQASESRLKAILKEIPEWAREEIKKARTLVRSTPIITAVKSRAKTKK